MNKEEVLKLFKESKSRAQVINGLGLNRNGYGYREVESLIKEYNIDIKHFIGGGKQNKYELVTKECPVCGGEFETRKGRKDEKTVCSKSCSNTYFRSGINHPNWNDNSYRSTCFIYHEHKCVVCDETKVLDVHHYDCNRNNNSPDNLIPICPTHHRYIHSKYKDEVIGQVINYRDDFIKNNDPN